MVGSVPDQLDRYAPVDTPETPSWIPVVAAPTIAVAVVAFIILLIVQLGWLIALIGAIVVAGLFFAALWFMADSIVIRLIGARPAAAGDHPRIQNLVDELCVRAGLPEPDLYVVDSAEPGAAAFGRRAGNIAFTAGLVDTLSVIELEGVLARELSRIRSGENRLDTLSVVFLRLPLAPFGSFGAQLVDRVRGDDRDVIVDLAGVSITRYPPGLMKALQHLRDRSPKVPSGSQLTEHLWTRGPDRPPGVPGSFTIDDRIAVLREL